MHSHERHSLSASHGNLLSASQSGRTSPTRTGGGHTRPGDSRPRVEGMQRQFGERSSSISPLREPPRPSSSSQRSITEERRLLPSARSAYIYAYMYTHIHTHTHKHTHTHGNLPAFGELFFFIVFGLHRTPQTCWTPSAGLEFAATDASIILVSRCSSREEELGCSFSKVIYILTLPYLSICTLYANS